MEMGDSETVLPCREKLSPHPARLSWKSFTRPSATRCISDSDAIEIRIFRQFLMRLKGASEKMCRSRSDPSKRVFYDLGVRNNLGRYNAIG